VGADNPGAGSDCWGCHGFGFASASAPGAGPTAPFIASADVLAFAAGTDTPITLSGSGFTNTLGAFEWKSSIVLTPADGSAVVLTPDTIDTCQCTVIIPGSTAPGNYNLKAVKDDAESNPIVISIKPAVMISSTQCAACTGLMTINGSGFGDAPPEGAEDYINVEQDGIRLEIVSWTDTQIQVYGGCGYEEITVNALFGSATRQQ
jgi:hypothetical protein